MEETAGEGTWYWCLRHRRAETADRRCAARDILGPYASADEASRWKDRVEDRNESWEEEDRRWSDDDL